MHSTLRRDLQQGMICSFLFLKQGCVVRSGGSQLSSSRMPWLPPRDAFVGIHQTVELCWGIDGSLAVANELAEPKLLIKKKREARGGLWGDKQQIKKTLNQNKQKSKPEKRQWPFAFPYLHTKMCISTSSADHGLEDGGHQLSNIGYSIWVPSLWQLRGFLERCLVISRS